jgi:hypothetical protein
MGSQLSDHRLAGQMFTTWQQKNLGDELNFARGELLEARRRQEKLEEENRTLAQQNAWLKQQLDIRNDSDDLLRDIRNRVSVESERDGLNSGQPNRGLCGSVCALLGRR